jgi:Domain of unknown function (DUF4258)
VIRYTDHARRRMAERGVTEQDVELAIRRRRRVTPGPPGSIWIWGYAGGRELKVGVWISDQEMVRTVAWPDE